MVSAPAGVVWGHQKKEGPMSLGWKGTMETIRDSPLEVLGYTGSWVPTMVEGGTGRKDKFNVPMPWAYTANGRFSFW